MRSGDTVRSTVTFRRSPKGLGEDLHGMERTLSYKGPIPRGRKVLATEGLVDKILIVGGMKQRK